MLANRIPPPPTRRVKPRLSPDKINKQFIVIPFTTRDSRFVLWYYFTTNLDFQSIAIARNATFCNNQQQLMTARQARNIVNKIVRQRLPTFKGELAPDGHFPRPIGFGWAPCDHGMCCSKLAETGGKPSIVRSLRRQAKNEHDNGSIATTIWHGTWDELLACPRDHSAATDKEQGNSRSTQPEECLSSSSISSYSLRYRFRKLHNRRKL
ncbi:uncharacterized protein PV06_03155 [Exophiala oligosperma]|uniref:Uncharacterized protein n=1 Tax=Exophiala oligosperma TaxID=215243 RepID=A0A0D2E9R0_9EURO|nr:uncharacterized protein PV06_03155 [Exophiala oligosperma]KIW44704.1 hypothetical protein PV06_03155 [Exophiala oligosperma]